MCLMTRVNAVVFLIDFLYPICLFFYEIARARADAVKLLTFKVSLRNIVPRLFSYSGGVASCSAESGPEFESERTFINSLR